MIDDGDICCGCVEDVSVVVVGGAEEAAIDVIVMFVCFILCS